MLSAAFAAIFTSYSLTVIFFVPQFNIFDMYLRFRYIKIENVLILKGTKTIHLMAQ